MTKFTMYTEVQNDEITTYLAEQEELQQKDLGHLTGRPLTEEDVSLIVEGLDCYWEACKSALKCDLPEDEEKETRGIMQKLETIRYIFTAEED